MEQWPTPTSENDGTLESARNKVRHLLHQRNPTLFPYGQAGTSISEMIEQLLRSDNIIASKLDAVCGMQSRNQPE